MSRISACTTFTYFYFSVIQRCILYMTLALIFCMLSAPMLHAAADFPAPDWLRRTPIAEKMIIHGIPSQVEYFEAERDVDAVLEFYRQRWQGNYAGHAGYREAYVDPWHVISRLEERHLLTVQVRRQSALNADGYLAIADLDEIGAEQSTSDSIPKMAGTKVLNHNTSFDPGKKGEVVMLANKFSVDTNGSFYRDYYRDRGWATLQDQELNDARAMAFRRLGSEVRLVVKKSDMGAVVVINRVTSD